MTSGNPRQPHRWASFLESRTSEKNKSTLLLSLLYRKKERIKMKTFKFVALLFVVCLSSVDGLARAPQKNSTLHSVRKIYIDALGSSPEAVRFRLLLEDELTNFFQVVSSPTEADAVLTGVVSVSRSGIYGGASDIGVTARLITSGGQRVWSGNFGGQIYILNPVRSVKFKEPLEYRAKEFAKRLRRDWQKSA